MIIVTDIMLIISIILFGILYLLEYKSINILFNFIGMVISIAFLFAINNCQYISYILALVYLGALTILFGFVIMITPAPNEISSYKFKNNIFLLIIMILIIIPFVYYKQSDTLLLNVMPVLPGEEWIDKWNNNSLLNNIGKLIYTDWLNNIKFIILTLILFISLIGLFNIL